MSRLKFAIAALILSFTWTEANVWANDTCVIILHGLGRTKWSMYLMERSLRKAGYMVWNESYPSTDETIADLAKDHLSKGLVYCNENNASQVHFVTHSMGGILLRQYFQTHPAPKSSRAVMLASPNQGSEIVDVLKDYWIFSASTGPAGQQLGTEENSLPKQLAPIALHIGIIAGESSSDPWFSPLISGSDDGKVSVESTKLEEMADFFVVDSGHTFIMNNRSVIEQSIYFLKHGKFRK